MKESPNSSTVSLMVLLSLLFLHAFVAGCAQITITEMQRGGDGKYRYTDGLPFYLGAPYLAVTMTNGQCLANVIYLPDMSKRYVARLISGIGTANLSAKLEGGLMLTEFGGVSDSKAAEIIVAAIAGLASAKSANLIPPTGDCSEGLYAIQFGADGRVNGLKGPIRFAVTQ